MKKIIILFVYTILLCGCSYIDDDTRDLGVIDSIDKEIKLNSNETNIVEKVNVDENRKVYYGEWEISNVFFSMAPSVWGKDELEEFVGKKLKLSSEKVTFDEIELTNPVYDERVMLPEELVVELVTTYEALGLDSTQLSTLVTIYSNHNMVEANEWISQSIIYRFFIKDEDTIIAENRNAYFELIRIK